MLCLLTTTNWRGGLEGFSKNEGVNTQVLEGNVSGKKHHTISPTNRRTAKPPGRWRAIKTPRDCRNMTWSERGGGGGWTPRGKGERLQRGIKLYVCVKMPPLPFSCQTYENVINFKFFTPFVRGRDGSMLKNTKKRGQAICIMSRLSDTLNCA